MMVYGLWSMVYGLGGYKFTGLHKGGIVFEPVYRIVSVAFDPLYLAVIKVLA